MILTLTESVTLDNPNYLFIFRHILTSDIVAFVKLNSDDLSAFTQRYNQFNINPSVVFAGNDYGEWHYGVYEQISTSNLDPTGLHALEYGKLILDKATDYAPTKYQSATSYKAYQG
jgi:hypothetical protein